jgi:predicted metallopeptidase
MVYSTYKKQRILCHHFRSFKPPTIVKLLREEKMRISDKLTVMCEELVTIPNYIMNCSPAPGVTVEGTMGHKPRSPKHCRP